ncbi:MAG: acyl-CoA synthetase [Achromobacter sp.]|jgi:fatty-acyl-CoA synthase|uniref:Long-chain-fatty-acid--CoA ligase n=3 Tax=Achromobacter insuavis TaxID=1287735 RepID=A0A6J5ADM8_9BURK|nr:MULTISPECIES: acyl-CoA synthetase [Achromobacter]MBN9639617.1 acyl-CoA synthetase [Achromobacter sp.]CAB3658674.1 Long-chain-fatty-acid--CoA ligase [Achromobacter insuavis]CUJ72450.1 Short-chain-fatty-acid--CoA ligase [Achromobacter sp. 2789STDY5608633]CUJ79834.1 Short-chain-fatty-acid--CoA ligase [Achromobacter sp. 2789STDY5608628]
MTPPSTDALPRNAANHQPLTPLGFLQWAAAVYPERAALLHGDRSQSWRVTDERCRRMAAALAAWGVRRGDVVAVLAPNTPALYEAHFGVPMAGAVLNALNTRLDARTLAFILEHGGATVLLYDSEYAALVREVLGHLRAPPRTVRIEDSEYAGPHGDLGDAEYEAWLAAQPADAPWEGPPDEWDNLCLNYTSGTTGNPKGVLYHHRGAYLNATGNVLACGMPPHAVYLWTLPMFHCNGWCFPWTLAALAGTSVCLRRVEPAAIFEAIRRHQVGFFCAAPVVLNMLVNAPADVRHRATHRVQAMTGGAAPPAAIIEAMEQLGIGVTHLYGLTETYGPSISCAWHEEWDDLPLAERAALKARIGVRKLNVEAVQVMDAAMRPVPADGVTLGEIMLRGNTLMKGYLRNPDATAEAFAGGWFHSGDLAVVHPDGYIEIKDRAKDIIISGGENISTVEIESVLYRHPDVLEAAVVARPDAVWGETPCAFVTLKEGASRSADELIAYCREHLARFKTPRTVVFGALPKTSTGKIQKFVLREQAAALADRDPPN